MRRVAIPVVLMLLLAGCSAGTISGAGLADANRLYEAGRFAESIAAYQELVNAGVQDGTLHYNLGNAYFKVGDLGRAILSYRRAQQALPRDRDVMANLELARSQTRDRLETDGGGPLVGFVHRVLVSGTTMDELAGIVLALWITLCGLLIVIIWRPGTRPRLKYPIAVVVVLLGLSLTSAAVRMVDEAGGAPAVVVVESVETHSGPGSDYLTEFSLHAGTEVSVLGARNGWVRVALPGDLQGWVPGETVEEV